MKHFGNAKTSRMSRASMRPKSCEAKEKVVGLLFGIWQWFCYQMLEGAITAAAAAGASP